MIDELTLDIAFALLSSGERIFDATESFDFEPVEVEGLAAHYPHALPPGRAIIRLDLSGWK